MYILTIMPLLFAGAISDRNSGDNTVRAPAPRPPHTLANSRKLKMPDEKTCMRMPLAHTRVASLYDLNRPILSLRKKAIIAPMAAPSTAREVILAVRLASPEGVSVLERP